MKRKTDDMGPVTAETGDGFGRADWGMGFLFLSLSLLHASLRLPLPPYRLGSFDGVGEIFPIWRDFMRGWRFYWIYEDAGKQSDFWRTAWKLFWVRLKSVGRKFMRYIWAVLCLYTIWLNFYMKSCFNLRISALILYRQCNLYLRKDTWELAIKLL